MGKDYILCFESGGVISKIEIKNAKLTNEELTFLTEKYKKVTSDFGNKEEVQQISYERYLQLENEAEKNGDEIGAFHDEAAADEVE